MKMMALGKNKEPIRSTAKDHISYACSSKTPQNVLFPVPVLYATKPIVQNGQPPNAKHTAQMRAMLILAVLGVEILATLSGYATVMKRSTEMTTVIQAEASLPEQRRQKVIRHQNRTVSMKSSPRICPWLLQLFVHLEQQHNFLFFIFYFF